MQIHDFPLRFTQLMFIGLSSMLAYTGHNIGAIILITGVPLMELTERGVSRMIDNRFGGNTDD
jgi:hypothetical protein